MEIVSILAHCAVLHNGICYNTRGKVRHDELILLTICCMTSTGHELMLTCCHSTQVFHKWSSLHFIGISRPGWPVATLSWLFSSWRPGLLRFIGIAKQTCHSIQPLHFCGSYRREKPLFWIYVGHR